MPVIMFNPLRESALFSFANPLPREVLLPGDARTACTITRSQSTIAGYA
jgi:hypothetical protein